MRVLLGVERNSDQSKDAVQIDLPIQPDRRPIDRRQLADLLPGQPVTIPEIDEPVRDGTLRRTLLVSSQPALLRMAAALDYLQQYPYGCTEQRISLARAELALHDFRDTLMLDGKLDRLDGDVKDTLTTVAKATNGDGLVSFWPGAKGYVFLTAWSVQFMVEARDAGYEIDQALFDKQIEALRQALRSDYTQFVSGIEYDERIWSLTALAEAGQADDAYAAELAHRTQWLNLEALAHVTEALGRSSATDPATLADLMRQTWAGIVTRLYQGKEIYGGLQTNATSGVDLIIPSETRTVAQVLRAVATSEDEPKKQLLVNALVTLGRGDGWGNTNANAEALLALTKFIGSQPATAPSAAIDVKVGDAASNPAQVGAGKVMLKLPDPGLAKVVLTAPADASPAARRAGRGTLRAAAARQPGSAPCRRPGGQPRGPAGAGRRHAAHPHRARCGRQDAHLQVGEIDEDHVELVNPKDRNHVAVVIPLAAGMEPLNPALATAPPEAKPSGETTLTPSYVAFLDDRVTYFYDTLPKGTYQFYFRTRALTPGTFVQPAAYAEMMYDCSVNGNSSGAVIVVAPADAQ